MKVYKLISTYFLICSLFLSSIPAMGAAKFSANTNVSTSNSANMDADTKIATDYQSCKKMFTEYKKCSVDNPSASPDPSGTPAENTNLKSCQDKNIPSFVKNCTYCIPGMEWNGQFDDIDCETIKNKAQDDGVKYEKKEELGKVMGLVDTNIAQSLLVILVGFSAISDSLCFIQRGLAMYAPDIWLSIAGSTTYIAGEVIMAAKFQKDLEDLENDEDKLVGEKNSTVAGNMMDKSLSDQMKFYDSFLDKLHKAKLAYEWKKTMLQVVGTAWGLSAVASIAFAWFEISMLSNPLTVAGYTPTSTAKDKALGSCSAMIKVAGNTSLPSNSEFLFANFRKIFQERIIGNAIAADKKKSPLPGWDTLLSGVGGAVLSAGIIAVYLWKKPGYFPSTVGDIFRSVIHAAQSALAFLIAGKMSDAIEKVEEKEKIIQDIRAKIAKLNNEALGVVEKVTNDLTSAASQKAGATINSALSETNSVAQKFFAKSIIDGPEGVDCTKNINPTECRETMTAIDTQLSNTFSDANLGFISNSIDNLKLNPGSSGLLKGGLSGLKSVALGLGSRNAISLGNKFSNDYDSKKITPFRDAALKNLNAQLEKQGKPVVNLDADVKKKLNDLTQSVGGVSPSGSSLAGTGGLSGGTTTSANPPTKDLNRVDAPTMVSVPVETTEESSDSSESSSDGSEQLPTTPKVFNEKTFDNFVSEIKEKKHDRGDADSLFSILNKAYKRNGYPVLLRPKKEKIKVPVPPPPQS